MSEMKITEIHNCEKSEGKIVGISLDYLGVTRCVYCNNVVNYRRKLRGENGKI